MCSARAIVERVLGETAKISTITPKEFLSGKHITLPPKRKKSAPPPREDFGPTIGTITPKDFASGEVFIAGAGSRRRGEVGKAWRKRLNQIVKPLPESFDVKDWILNVFEGPRRIAITYTNLTPVEDEDGDTQWEEESGWEDEEGVDMEPDEIDKEDGITAVDKAVDFLWDHGATEPSSSHFHPGIWYSTQSESDMQTGVTTDRHYHLKAFDEEEEQAVFNRLKFKEHAWRHRHQV